jgi:hypothetical protein
MNRVEMIAPAGTCGSDFGAASARSPTVSVVFVWLHGAFGAGKTSVAAEISARRDEVVLCDPEVVGYMLRELLPVPSGDFQDLPEWRALVVAIGEALDARSRRLVLAPMTLLREDYAEEIFYGLRARDVALHQVLLDASDEGVAAAHRG